MNTIAILSAAAALWLALQCYWTVGGWCLASARTNAAWMSRRDHLPLLVAFVAAPLVMLVVGVAALLIWRYEEGMERREAVVEREAGRFAATR